MGYNIVKMGQSILFRLRASNPNDYYGCYLKKEVIDHLY